MTVGVCVWGGGAGQDEWARELLPHDILTQECAGGGGALENFPPW